ncbi:MAG: dialkylresorcinol condensing enzyme [Thermodesulfobacteriota bacterium]|nr:dialkylresorcinol condensing enzyme [Thermodesulfobacteriota bacterium]
MKKILILYYSQSGQLQNVLQNLITPLQQDNNISCDYRAIQPLKPFPYPWKFYEFLDTFPEAVYLNGCEVEEIDCEDDYDLIILGYTVWFLSPSLPVTGFLQSKQAKKLFKDKPVITVIACRDMWLMAQEKMKPLLDNLNAHLIDNVVLTDQGKSIYTFLTTPRWMLTGRKNPFWFFPPAGVAETEIQNTARFGKRLCEALAQNKETEDTPLLQGLESVNVQGKLIATERIAHRSFLIWSKLIKKAGKPGSDARKVVLTIYSFFLLTLVLTIVPINIIIRKLLYPFRKKHIKKAINYYEQPSGK